MPDDERAAVAATPEGERVDPRLLVRLLPERYPLQLIDRVVAGEDGRRLVGRKSVTAGEPYFAGHFPGHPMMPGVLLCEALVQTSALLIARSSAGSGADATLALRGLERTRFRQPVVPGDVLELDVRTLGHEGTEWRFRGAVRVRGTVVAETDFSVTETASTGTAVHPTAVVAPGAMLGVGVRIGPYAVIGPHVAVGDGTTVGPHAVLDGHTTIGARNRIFQFASVGAEPQDL